MSRNTLAAIAAGLVTLSCFSVALAEAPVPTSVPQKPMQNTSPSQPAQAGALVTVPDGTVVLVHLLAPLSSSQNAVDDVFDVSVVDPVIADGYVIVDRNALGRGHVVKTDPAGGHGHPGTIAVVLDYIYAVDGLKIRVKPTTFTQEGGKARGAAAVAGFFTYGIASNAVKGSDAAFEPSRIFTLHVDGAVHITSTEKSAISGSDDGFAK